MRDLPEEIEGAACPYCGEKARYRTCEYCGISAWIIDCIHYDQPRPISADPDGHLVCDDCWETRQKNEYDRRK